MAARHIGNSKKASSPSSSTTTHFSRQSLRRKNKGKKHEEDDTSTGAFPVVPRRKRGRFVRAVNGRSSSIGNKIVTSLLIVVLCALLGYGYVAQNRATDTSYSSLSEDELVRLLDETNNSITKLEQQSNTLSKQLKSVQRAANKQAQIEKLAEENAEVDGILSGTLPATGKGVIITISKASKIDAAILFNLIEELRNAGAEVIDLDGVRVVTSTYVVDTRDGLMSDGSYLSTPYVIKAIGNPTSLNNAVEIAGGVGSKMRVQYKAKVKVEQSNSVSITSLHAASSYTYAKTVE